MITLGYLYFPNKKKSSQIITNNKENFYQNYQSYESKSKHPSDIQSTLEYNDVPCMIRNREKRYMYQYVPTSKNSSYDLRKPAAFIPPVETSDYGIFYHTTLFGNYTHEPICPNFG